MQWLVVRAGSWVRGRRNGPILRVVKMLIDSRGLLCDLQQTSVGLFLATSGQRVGRRGTGGSTVVHRPGTRWACL